ncbi:DUF6171 family protein [Jeotgalibaca caeni]|uniref:DUF6171 family protein n=1 Tax=Jeotgalibaca caeni TaxID=3028623 RepID=UPI00237E9C43|nr:DUF6171 family protein [Jeotgalibaca caeni]MDE1549577.1 DUF6171 family protein [Jeotgalibaca caeni]
MSCKGCERRNELLQLTDEKIQEEIEEQLSMEIDLASPELRDSRLSICATCPFRAQHTCSKCGCYVGFRASLNGKVCPVGKW